MFALLKNHPFAVEAFFESSLVLTFAVPKEQLQDLIPEPLQLDTLNDKWAFVAMALVQTKNLRPKGFPKLLGNDFFLIGYRIFTRYINNSGKRLRGLYILKSETDKKKMELLGNLFTHYSYSTTDISQKRSGDDWEISSRASAFRILVSNGGEEVTLPHGSPFKDWNEARKFAGPLPFTFSYDAKKKKMLIIEGLRENWKPQRLKVIDYDISFLKKMKIDFVLANAFVIHSIPYHWKKGRTEKWKS